MEIGRSKREQNKAQKKASFLDAAEKLFVQKGFENTSIDDVAAEAGLTKRTLYQYFDSKEDLFFAVAVKGVRQLTRVYEEAIEKGKNAHDRIRLANKAYLQFYQENLGMFRLLNYQPANQQSCEASPNYCEMRILDGVRMKHYADIIEEAKADGSIKSGLDLKKAVFFGFFSPFSMLFTVSAAGKGMWDAIGIDEGEFFSFSFDLLADALK